MGERTITTHTPAPWIYEPGDAGDATVGLGPTPPAITHETPGGEMVVVCTLDVPSYRADRAPVDEWDECLEIVGDMHANGRLIEAAPDLIEACRAALAAFGDTKFRPGATSEKDADRFAAVLQLSAAIEKAAGEPPP